MSSNRPRIGVPVDCKLIGTDPSHVVGEKYLAAVAHAADSIPLVLPARAAGDEQASLETQISADDQLADLDGLFLTGSPSNMEPWRYGSDAPGVGPFDPQRDANNLALLGAAMARDMPVFTVCRGFQELNVACGGTLYTAVQEVPGCRIIVTTTTPRGTAAMRRPTRWNWPRTAGWPACWACERSR